MSQENMASKIYTFTQRTAVNMYMSVVTWLSRISLSEDSDQTHRLMRTSDGILSIGITTLNICHRQFIFWKKWSHISFVLFINERKVAKLLIFTIFHNFRMSSISDLPLGFHNLNPYKNEGIQTTTDRIKLMLYCSYKISLVLLYTW